MDYIPAKHILIRSKSTAWFGTDHTVNLYRGCCHGCLYCDSRSDCYRNPNFDQVTAKADALRILRDELARKVRPAFIGMGAMSDPYNPFEGELPPATPWSSSTPMTVGFRWTPRATSSSGTSTCISPSRPTPR